MRIYYGVVEDEDMRIILATVTGQMSDGSLVYTEIAQTSDGAIEKENGEPKLILENQYRRYFKKGLQTFVRL